MASKKDRYPFIAQTRKKDRRKKRVSLTCSHGEERKKEKNKGGKLDFLFFAGPEGEGRISLVPSQKAPRGESERKIHQSDVVLEKRKGKRKGSVLPRFVGPKGGSVLRSAMLSSGKKGEGKPESRPSILKERRKRAFTRAITERGEPYLIAWGEEGATAGARAFCGEGGKKKDAILVVEEKRKASPLWGRWGEQERNEGPFLISLHHLPQGEKGGRRTTRLTLMASN